MAMRRLNQDTATFDDRIIEVDIVGTVNTGATAVTPLTYGNRAVTSIAISGSDLVITLQDSYTALLGVSATVLPASPGHAVVGGPDAGGLSGAGMNVVTVVFAQASAGTSYSFAAGDTVYVTLRLKS